MEVVDGVHAGAGSEHEGIVIRPADEPIITSTTVQLVGPPSSAEVVEGVRIVAPASPLRKSFVTGPFGVRQAI
jgi:hypothetical protein